MSKYIYNLSDNLIRKHHFDEIWFDQLRFKEDEFFGHVRRILRWDDVEKLAPQTLGRVICSFEVGMVPVNRQELFDKVGFTSNCEETLRDLVAVCLAYFIRERLLAIHVNSNVKQYVHRG